jgi:acetyl esterase/lipase
MHPMLINLRCRKCGKRYQLKNSAAGRKFRCKECEAPIKVPQPEPEEVEDIWEADSFEDEEDDWDDPVPAPSRRSPSRKKKKKKSFKFPIGKVAIGVGAVFGLLLIFTMGTVFVRMVRERGEWQEFRPPGGGFRISMPGKPKPMPKQAQLPQMQGRIYETKRNAYAILWSPIPSPVGVTITQQLDAFRDGALANTPGSRLITESPVQMGQHQGREIKMEASGLEIVTRIFIIRSILYIPSVAYSSSLPQNDIDRFFDSFVLDTGETTGEPVTDSPASDNDPAGQDTAPSFLEQRKSFKTQLTRRGPAPQEYDPETPPAGVKEVRYRSGNLNLKAWVSTPRAQPGKKFPALVFFHGGFAFGAGDLEECKPFMDAGFVVMAPMLRGENGNSGQFELFHGEVDDARAAVKWIASHPNVDRDRIYTFGHSVGGGISAMLSLLDDVPLQHGGSSGGLYDQTVFDGWSDITPFDRSNAQERKLRVLVGNVKDMQHEHTAYLGTADNFQSSAAMAQREGGTKLKVEMIPGDHFTSFQPALRRYLAKIQSENR